MSLKLPDMKLIFIDTETTSLARPGTEPTGRVIEFCGTPVDVSINLAKKTFTQSGEPQMRPWFNVRRDQTVHFRLQLTKKDLANADKESLRVNKYHADTRPFAATTALNDKKTQQLWQSASDVMAGRILCSQNVAFDIQFIEKELALYGLLDTKRWQRKHVELWTLSLLTQLTEPAFHLNKLPPAVKAGWEKNNIISLSDAAQLTDGGHSGHVAHTTTGDVGMGIELFEYFFTYMSH